MTAVMVGTNGHKIDVEDLYREQRARLVGHAARVGRDAHAAEDAVQDAFVDLIGKNRQADNPAAYVTVAARNAAINDVRHRQRQAPAGEHMDREPDAGSDGSGLDVCMADPRVAARVEEALKLVTDDQRVAIVAHCLNGRRISEIARDLGIHHTSVYDRINRGLANLRTAGVGLPGLDDVLTPEEAKLPPALAASVEVLRSTYGDTPPADLPGTCELARIHVWPNNRASLARKAYTGSAAPARGGVASTKTAKKPAKAKGAGTVRTPVESAPTLPAEPTPAVTPVVAEAWLSTSGEQVTCMFVNSDESTIQHPAVFRSMGGAQREITGHLVGGGYRPTGPWVNHSDDESSRNFSKEGN